MAGLIPQLVLDEILAQTDIVQLIDAYLPLKKQGANYTACCPFHNEKTPSFNVIPKKQFYYCFGCGASGNAISFIMQHQQQGFVEAVEVLATRLGLTLPRSEKTNAPLAQKKRDAYALLEAVTQDYQKELKAQGSGVQQYLTQRGLSEEIIQAYELGYAPDDWHYLEKNFKADKTLLLETGMLVQKEGKNPFDRYRHRLMFPIRDRQGRVIGFGGRALEANQQPKYMNSPETPWFHKSKALYGLHQILKRASYQGPILVVEGYMDVIALAQYGLFYSVATLGTATTFHHLQLLSKYTKEVVFCFDGDEAGKQAAWRALENSLPIMDGSLEVKFMFLPEGEDPDSFVRKQGSDAFVDLMKKAPPLNEYWIATMSRSIALESISGKSQLIQTAIPFLNQMPKSPYQTLLIEQLSRLSRIDAQAIKQQMQRGIFASNEHAISISRSPLRLAMALLLQYPEQMLETLDALVLEVEEEPAILVLKDLMAYLKAHPKANTAMLIEPWRETQWFDALQKLSTWAHGVPEGAVNQEFIDLINYLNRQSIEKKIQYLMGRSRTSGLSVTEQSELQALLRRRHQLA